VGLVLTVLAILVTVAAFGCIGTILFAGQVTDPSPAG
jgi:hypothetical protein